MHCTNHQRVTMHARTGTGMLVGMDAGQCSAGHTLLSISFSYPHLPICQIDGQASGSARSQENKKAVPSGLKATPRGRWINVLSVLGEVSQGMQTMHQSTCGFMMENSRLCDQKIGEVWLLGLVLRT